MERARDHAHDVLEFPAVLRALAGRTRSVPGRERVLARAPMRRPEDARAAQAETADLLAAHEAGDPPPTAAPPDLGLVLQRLETEGSTLRGEELWQIAVLLEQAGQILTWYRKRREDAPGLERLLGGLDPAEGLRRDLVRAIDPSGAVKDDASPELSKIRRSIRSLRERLASKLESILRAAGSPESFVTLREERYVIAIPSSNRRSVPGAVLGHSGSGASVFVEPREAAEGNSELAERASDEAREVERILRSLSVEAHRHHGALMADLAALAGLDAAEAVASWAIEVGAVLPVIADERRLLLRGARHPILVLRHVRGEMGPPVPLDLELDAENPVLLVTGPNMGGKTVAMKTVGLLSLMAMAGLPVTAAHGTTFAWFDRIVCDIGDEQSIQDDVSTFLSHVRRVTQALAAATDRSLVLLDELGSGTDPAEGAALGQAVLEALLQRGAMTLATTHHGSLKTFAHETAGVRNASMAFDEATLRSLFRLVVGVPGGSRAIQVAERFGMDAAVLARARTLLPEGERDLNRLIEELGRLREEAVAERRRLTETQAKLRERESELRSTRERLESERKERKQAEIAARRELLRQLESQIDDYRKKVRSERKASAETLQQGRGLAKAMEESIAAEDAAAQPAPAERGAPLRTVREGDKIFVPALRAEGTALSLPDKDGRVRVKIGAATAVLPVSQLRSMQPSAAGAARPGGKRDERSEDEEEKDAAAQAPVRGAAIATPDLEDTGTQVDVRGYEADDAVRAVERFLEDAAVGGQQTVRIIHGKGRGILREHMKRFLAHNQLVKEFRLGEMGEGGTGVTIVTLEP
ncbi:MAG TPA: Smr/MutS family protein [Candidatus Eisenbacteria bacterium]|nr:Smr/MutS family protein [Candidatus Eisenbacteria bacterium]